MPPASKPEPGFLKMLGRGMLRRCPWCAGRRSFIRRWLGKYERCQTCGIRWRREPGMEFGALMMNTFITFLVLAVAMAVGLIATAPDFDVLPLILICVALAIAVPLAAYPFTFTVWLAVDLATHRPSQAELLDAAAHVQASPKV